MNIDAFRSRYPTRRVTIGGLTWGVIETAPPAPGPALLLLPGTLGTAEIFWNQIAALADRARIISVTYPIIGDIHRLADGLDGLCEALALPRAMVVGSSLGGYLAQILAALHPDRVEQLGIGNSLSDPTLINPTGRPRAGLAQLPAAAHRAIVLDSLRSWPEPEPVFSALKEVLLDSGNRLLSARALKARVLAVQTGKPVPSLPIPDERIVIIDCADDPLIPQFVRDDTRRRYPAAELCCLPVGGHYPYITRAAEYTAILARRLGLT